MLSKITLILSLLTASLLAQEPRQIEVRTLCFGYSNSVREVTLTGDPAGEDTLDTKLAKHLDNHQDVLTVVGDEVRVGQKDGSGSFQSWSKTAIPKGASEVLFVLFPSGIKEKPYLIKAYNDGARGFPLASFQISNMSESTLRLIVGDEPIELAPGQSKNISKFKKVKKNGQVPYYVYSKDGSEWKRLSTGLWDILPRKRNFQIAWTNPDSKNVEIRGYEDSLPLVKALLKQQAE
ncbi:hypothetical protein [Roseibacillus persicicus]|uniref:Uncharacterized protein n=1 Tax=Roseibacillus persicicus TaxID=454148 RepID=A0A918WP38_9BACT|nr:hypothetical protein [Roseibacillus persicicus]MDQ8190563.1 hypothetical protein [Roseibacillus persicicus]GHC61115.1 hypothetical protein GCM10007100_30490 [Roseibacillus persicicus]